MQRNFPMRIRQETRLKRSFLSNIFPQWVYSCVVPLIVSITRCRSLNAHDNYQTSIGFSWRNVRNIKEKHWVFYYNSNMIYYYKVMNEKTYSDKYMIYIRFIFEQIFPALLLNDLSDSLKSLLKIHHNFCNLIDNKNSTVLNYWKIILTIDISHLIYNMLFWENSFSVKYAAIKCSPDGIWNSSFDLIKCGINILWILK